MNKKEKEEKILNGLTEFFNVAGFKLSEEQSSLFSKMVEEVLEELENKIPVEREKFPVYWDGRRLHDDEAAQILAEPLTVGTENTENEKNEKTIGDFFGWIFQNPKTALGIPDVPGSKFKLDFNEVSTAILLPKKNDTLVWLRGEMMNGVKSAIIQTLSVGKEKIPEGMKILDCLIERLEEKSKNSIHVFAQPK